MDANFELENHLKAHKEGENIEYNTCGKAFVLKCGLTKHMSGHETDRFCHYYNNQKCCPYMKKLGASLNMNQNLIASFLFVGILFASSGTAKKGIRRLNFQAGS